jgi:hypothetical protein
MDVNKTRVYLERSKSSSIHLSLVRERGLSPRDPFLELVPDAIGRLGSLTIEAPPEHLHDITAHLSRPAPLLKRLDISGGCQSEPQRNPVLTTALFNGDLSPLREFLLWFVRTELPWRNMVNLTSFTLGYTSSGEISIRQLLDFFESAPCLREIKLYDTTPTSGAQNGRLVSLACLENMEIIGDGSPSLFLDHLLIPVGAKLAIRAEVDHLPRSLDNLRNLSNFTKINLYIDKYCSRVRFTGPNGEVSMVPMASNIDLLLEFLARFDTSKTELLEILRSNPPSRDAPHRALLPMKTLRTLMLYRCENIYTFMDALRPSMSSSEVVVCPKLEELILDPADDGKRLYIESVIGMAAARASRGAKLKSVRIAGRVKFAPMQVLELRKHVLHVECDFGVDDVSNDGDGGDEND